MELGATHGARRTLSFSVRVVVVNTLQRGEDNAEAGA